jgi:hypothetical protein
MRILDLQIIVKENFYSIFIYGRISPKSQQSSPYVDCYKDKLSDPTHIIDPKGTTI